MAREATDTDKLKEFGQMLCNVTSVNVEPNCFNDALVICVEQNNLEGVGKLLLKGATNWSALIGYSLQHEKYKVASLLLLCKAAQEDNVATIRDMYKPPDESTKHKADQQWHIKDVLDQRGLDCVAHVPIKLGLRKKNFTAVYELLLQTDCSVEEGRADWRGLALKAIDPQWLVAMGPWVSKLSLMSNFLTSVPKEVSKLVKLERLNLAHNDLTRIPSEIVLLPLLRSLTLANNNLVELPDQTEWTSSLSVLNLSNNRLKDLPKNMRTASLKQLRIAGNPMSELPRAVCLCQGLESLNISDTRITFLPNEMGRLTNLSELHTDNLDITDPSPSVMKTPRDCVRYLRQRLRGSEPYFKMKMMIVGYANRGKSTLVARLQGVDIGNLSTVGVSLTDWSYTPSVITKQKFTFQIWDFGGQEEYYATHQCFLSSRSLYVIVWRVTDGEDGIEELKLWLDNIAARAPQSSIIIVGTFLDKLSKEQRQSKYSEQLMQKVYDMVTHTPRYGKLDIKAVVNVSCTKEARENIDYLKTTIYEAAAEATVEKVKVMGMHIPASYLALDRQLTRKRVQLQQTSAPPIKRKHELRTLIQRTRGAADIDDGDELDLAVRFLHEIGTVLHFDDASGGLSDLYFIDPRWLCDMMAVIVTVRERNPYVQNGILKMSSLPLLFKGKRFPSSLFPEYVRLLNRFEIALPLDQNHILIPSMLPDSPPEDVPLIKSSTPVLRRQHSMVYIPPGFWSRLIARLLLFVKEISQVMPTSSSGELLVQSVDENERPMFSIDSTSVELEQEHGASGVSMSDSGSKEASGSLESTDLEAEVHGDSLNLSLDLNTGSAMSLSLPQPVSSSSSLMSISDNSLILACTSAAVTPTSQAASPTPASPADSQSADIVGAAEPSEDSEWVVLFNEDHFGDDVAGGDSSPQLKRDKAHSRSSSDADVRGPRHNTLMRQKVNDLMARLSNDQCAVMKNHCLSYWRTGFCFNHPHLFFMLRQYDRDMYGRSGIETVTSAGPNGCRTLSRLADQINKLIEDWYPGLFGDDGRLKFVSQLCPCVECCRQGAETPNIFQFEPQLVQAVLSGAGDTVECKGHSSPAQLRELVPDLLLADLDRKFVLSSDEMSCSETDEVKLGQGAFGAVFLGECRGQRVAIKTYFDSSGSDLSKPLTELRQEVAVLQRISHPNLVGMVGVCQKPLRLVLDLAPLGALDTYLKQKRPLARVLIHRMAGQVAAALAYLHDQLIIFRDLKAANVLVWSLDLNDAINVKVTDYGIATFAAPTGLKGFEGTKGFQAPEMLRFSGKEEYTCMVDVYAFAMFLYQLIAQRPPFHSLGEVHISPAVLKGRRPALRDVPVSKCGFLYLTGLMRQCWSEDPLSRVPAADIAVLVHSTEFQCTLGALNIDGTSVLVQHACLVEQTSQLWVSATSGSNLLLHVYELSNLTEPLTSVTCTNVQCLLIVSKNSVVYVAVCSSAKEFFVYRYQSIKGIEPKQLGTIHETEKITSLLPLDNHMIVGTESGCVHVHSLLEKDRKSQSMGPQEISVGSYPITAMVQTHGRLWCASKRYIYVLEDEDWSLDGLWTHPNIENAISSLHVTGDGKTVWCSYADSLCLTCWEAERKGALVKDLRLDTLLDGVQSHIADTSTMVVAHIAVVMDTIWIACQSGHFLLVNRKSDKLIYVFHPYHGDIGVFFSSMSCQPCGTEKGIVVSCGRSWRPYNTLGELMLPRNLISDNSKTKNTVVLWEALSAEDLDGVVQLEKSIGSSNTNSGQFVQNGAQYSETNEWLDVVSTLQTVKLQQS